MNRKTLAKYLDLANHHQEATPEAIKELCHQVRKHRFHSAFVNPYYVSLARKLMGEDGVVGTVIAFPLGQETRDVKTLAAIKAVKDGTDELDVSMNVGLFKAGKEDEVLEEMEAVVVAVKNIKKTALVKFIIETGLLGAQEIQRAAELVLNAEADFVKTNSGWGPRGASLEDVRLIRKAVGERIKIKVAGGIDTYKEATDFINAGADRIGTSKAVEIIEEVKEK